MKNPVIEIYRFIFMLVLCTFHFIAQYKDLENVSFLKGGYLGTEFFFLISGFFLAKKLDGLPKSDNLEMTLKLMSAKIRKLYPAFFFSFLCYTFFYFCIGRFSSVSDFVDYLYNNVFALVLLNASGIPVNDVFSGNMWYLSALFISTFFFTICFLNWREKFLAIFAPAFTIIFLGFSGHIHGSISIQDLWSGFIYGALGRSFSEILIGGGYI